MRASGEAVGDVDDVGDEIGVVSKQVYVVVVERGRYRLGGERFLPNPASKTDFSINSNGPTYRLNQLPAAILNETRG